MRRSPQHEAGFTLVELLTVMVILTVLAAVAIPTLLSQKSTAVKTQATDSLAQVVHALESCAANTENGGYRTAEFDCGDPTTLVEYEKSLSNHRIQAEAPALATTDTASTQVLLSPAAQGYIVQKLVVDSGVPVYFATIHADTGVALKLCSAREPLTLLSTKGLPDPSTKTCRSGTW